MLTKASIMPYPSCTINTDLSQRAFSPPAIPASFPWHKQSKIGLKCLTCLVNVSLVKKNLAPPWAFSFTIYPHLRTRLLQKTLVTYWKLRNYKWKTDVCYFMFRGDTCSLACVGVCVCTCVCVCARAIGLSFPKAWKRVVHFYPSSSLSTSPLRTVQKGARVTV